MRLLTWTEREIHTALLPAPTNMTKYEDYTPPNPVTTEDKTEATDAGFQLVWVRWPGVAGIGVRRTFIRRQRAVVARPPQSDTAVVRVIVERAVVGFVINITIRCRVVNADILTHLQCNLFRFLSDVSTRRAPEILNEITEVVPNPGAQTMKGAMACMRTPAFRGKQ